MNTEEYGKTTTKSKGNDDNDNCDANEQSELGYCELSSNRECVAWAWEQSKYNLQFLIITSLARLVRHSSDTKRSKRGKKRREKKDKKERERETET